MEIMVPDTHRHPSLEAGKDPITARSRAEDVQKRGSERSALPPAPHAPLPHFPTYVPGKGNSFQLIVAVNILHREMVDLKTPCTGLCDQWGFCLEASAPLSSE
jgi:hypothetical protein